MTLSHRLAIQILLVVVSLSGSFQQAHSQTTKPPNILVIVSDDQPDGTVATYMPITQERIFNQGATFTKAYITTPACCPSRVSMLTGDYASRHRVYTNQDVLRERTAFFDLHNAGYFTGHIGKFLNTWNGARREEYDYWVAFEGGSSRYTNARLNVQGRWIKDKKYLTDSLSDYAVDFFDNAAASNKPFALWFAPSSPHDPFVPADQALGIWTDQPVYRPPNFNDTLKIGKPQWLRKRKAISAADIKVLDEKRIKQLEMLWSLDQGIGKILNKLEEQQQLDNTIVVFISDNGLFWGEHGLWSSKDAVYEPVIKVPLAVRYPPLIPEPRVIDSLVGNIDIGAMLFEVSGNPRQAVIDGVSIAALLRNEVAPRSHIFIEGFLKTTSRIPFAAVHTGRYKYVMNFGDMTEFYDLERDPYELDNKLGETETLEIQSGLRQLLMAHLNATWKTARLKKIRNQSAQGRRKSNK